MKRIAYINFGLLSVIQKWSIHTVVSKWFVFQITLANKYNNEVMDILTINGNYTYLILSFRTLMFWLVVLYHVRHYYVVTKRQQCFNIHVVIFLQHGYYSMASPTTWKWQKSRLMILYVGNSSRRNKLHYTATNRKYWKAEIVNRTRRFLAKPNANFYQWASANWIQAKVIKIPIEEEPASDIQM